MFGNKMTRKSFDEERNVIIGQLIPSRRQNRNRAATERRSLHKSGDYFRNGDRGIDDNRPHKIRYVNQGPAMAMMIRIIITNTEATAALLRFRRAKASWDRLRPGCNETAPAMADSIMASFALRNIIVRA